MCSKCYRENAPAVQNEVKIEDCVIAPLGTSAVGGDESSRDESSKSQPKKDRCLVCKKKLRLAQRFNCKCEFVFCSEHRYADKHNCEFDYQSHGKNLIAKNNPTVVSEKLNKI